MHMLLLVVWMQTDEPEHALDIYACHHRTLFVTARLPAADDDDDSGDGDTDDDGNDTAAPYGFMRVVPRAACSGKTFRRANIRIKDDPPPTGLV